MGGRGRTEVAIPSPSGRGGSGRLGELVGVSSILVYPTESWA